MRAGYLRWLWLLSAMAAFVTQSAGASATVGTGYWEVRLHLAESRSVPANAGGLIVDLRDGAAGPTVPDDVGQLTEAQKAELASEIVEYGELALVDADGQLQAFDLRFHGDLLWLSFEIEPGDYALVSRSIPSD